MTDIKAVISKNLASLRQEREMTQLELAERLNYSDKAVSKWERGESLPDIAVLVEIADIFQVSLDYLIRPENDSKHVAAKRASKRRIKNRGFITGMSILLVLLLATMIFIITDITTNHSPLCWFSFIYAVPASLVVWLIFNTIWFNPRRNFLIISLLMWTLLAAIYFTLFRFNIWRIFALGIPGQVIVFMWSNIRGKSEMT